jgi:exodeoxyribonuclease V alpha subunit
MYLHNNYKMQLRNGFTGVVKSISSNGNITVKYRNGTVKVHTLTDCVQNMRLAYAITIHKSQGSQYPAVVVPCFEAIGRRMLSRNLLYTAVTRAEKKVVLLGTHTAIESSLKRDETQERKSILAQLLRKDSVPTVVDDPEQFFIPKDEDETFPPPEPEYEQLSLDLQEGYS